MYNNFIFDLYGTLIDIRTDEESSIIWQNFAAYLQRYNIMASAIDLKQEYNEETKKLLDLPSEFEYPEIDLFPVFYSICHSKNTNLTDADIFHIGEAFRKISTKYISLYPNTLKVLQSLKENGKKIFLLSNAQKVFTMQELSETKTIDYFDDIFISSEMGCRKPDKHFFDLLIKKHSLELCKSIMIGNDSTSDIAGANAAGLDSLYVRTAISPQNDPVPDCKYIFNDGDIGHVIELI